MSDASKSAPPWRHEVWRATCGREGDRKERWFLAVLKDGDAFWSITEPGTQMFLRSDSSPDDALYAELAGQGAFDLSVEEVEQEPITTGEAWTAYHRMRSEVDRLRTETNYLRSREAHFASVLKVTDGGQYRNDWTAPLQSVLDENKALHAEVDALRRKTITAEPVKRSAVSDASSAPPWETWRLTHGPEENRQTRWFLAVMLQSDDAPIWSIVEPRTGYFIAATKSPGNGVAHLAVNSNMVDPVIEKVDPGSPDNAHIGYGEGYTDGARAMRRETADRIERVAIERRSVLASKKTSPASKDIAMAVAAALGEMEREVRGQALPAVVVPRGK